MDRGPKTMPVMRAIRRLEKPAFQLPLSTVMKYIVVDTVSATPMIGQRSSQFMGGA